MGFVMTKGNKLQEKEEKVYVEQEIQSIGSILELRMLKNHTFM